MPVRHHLADVTSQLMNAHEKSNAIFTLHIIRKLRREEHITDEHRELLDAEVHQRNDDVICKIHSADPTSIRQLADELMEEHDVLYKLDGGRKSSRAAGWNLSTAFQPLKSTSSLINVSEVFKGELRSRQGDRGMRNVKSAPHLGFGADGSVMDLDEKETDKVERKQTERRVRFGELHIRTHSCTFGEACPSSNGPSVGLGWEVVGEESKSWMEWETERVDQGRMCAYEFAEEGRIPIQSRVDWLKKQGHRKVSIDVDTAQMRILRMHRRSSARSKCAVKVMEGEDPDEVEAWEHETLLAVVYRQQLHAWLKKARTKIRQRNKELGILPEKPPGNPLNLLNSQKSGQNNPFAGQRMNPLMQRNRNNPLTAQKKLAEKSAMLARAAGAGGGKPNPLLQRRGSAGGGRGRGRRASSTKK
jgi:hypothetical protein